MEIDRSVLDIAELYIATDNGSFDFMQSDLRMKFSERDVNYVTSVFPLNMRSGDDTEFILKIKNSSTFYFSIYVWEPSEFLRKVARNELFYGIYFGVLLCLLIYNLFIWMSIRESSYFYYVGYLGAVIWFQLIEVGHGVIHSGWLFEFFGKDFITYSIWVTTAFIIQFFRHFLTTHEKYPVADIHLKILLWVVFVSILVTPYVDKIVALYWASVFAVLFLGDLLFLSAYFIRRGDENAPYFLVAWLFNVTGFMIYSMMANGVMAANTITLHAAEIGIVCESSLLAFALAEKIKRSQSSILLSIQRTVNTSSKHRSLFTNSLEGKYEMDLYGLVKEINPAAAKFLGFSSSSDFMRNRLTAARDMYSMDQFSALLSTGRHRGEMYFESGTNRRWVIHSAHLVLDYKGEASYIDGTIFDITEDKERLLAIEKEVKERAGKEIALTNSLQKSKFLSSASHFIRTPLTSIVGFSEELKYEQISNVDKKYFADIVVENSRRLLHLINDILDYSKIDAGKLGIERIRTNVLNFLEGIYLDCKGKAESKKIHMDITFNYPFPKMILGDPTRIKQILENLCDNAVKFTNRGGAISLSIGFSKGTVFFLVSDTGCGLSGESFETLFDEDLLISKGKFGLVISKKLANLMGGDIHATSKDRKGSVFELSIPIKDVDSWVEDEEDRKGIEKNSDCKNHMVEPDLLGFILLAEDNVVNQILIKRLLEKMGLTVTAVSDGVQVCDVCDNTQPDLILMDINMPHRDGLEATRLLRSQGYKMPIYALSAETGDVEIERALDAGCNGFLQKPLDKPLLYEVLMQHLDKKSTSSLSNIISSKS